MTDAADILQSPLRKPLPLNAFIVPVTPVFFMGAVNLERITIASLSWTIAAALALYLAILFALRLLARKPQVTDAVLALAYCATFMPFMFLPQGQSRALWCVVCIAIIAAAIIWQEGRRIILMVLTGYCAIMMVYPLVMSSGIIGVIAKRGDIVSVAQSAFDELPAVGERIAEKPDIYYFVFDRYQRDDFLKSIYGHDNQPFLDELRKRGFFVAAQSYSNYQRTAHSVVSSLNFDYLDRLQTPQSAKSSDWLPLYDMFQDFRIGRVLKQMGYEIRFSGSWWEPTRRIASADNTRNFYELPELARVVYEHSLIVTFARAVGWREADPLYWQCQRSRLMFEDIRSAPNSGKPLFHFAHFLIPHPPFVTHESGRCMEIEEAQERTRAQNYVGQLKHANEQILQTVDALLARPGPKPVIILQADEGPWPDAYADDEITILGRDVSDVDWKTLDAETLREKMAILNAIYAPSMPQGVFSDAQSPVNTFRMLLKHYFDVPIETLPDRHKIYLRRNDLYSFEDVTEKIRPAPADR